MTEELHHAMIALLGRGSPGFGRLAAAAGQFATVTECSSRRELRELAQTSRDQGNPLALVILDESRENGEFIPILDEIRAISPLTVRAAAIDTAPRADTLQWFARDGFDRLLPLDRGDAEIALDLRMLLDRFSRLRRLASALRGSIGKHLFVTGANGFVGERIIREILRCSDAHVTALVRPKGSQSPHQRLGLGEGVSASRVDVVEGEITAPELGLNARVRDRLRESVDEVWHLAAITDFSKDIRDQLIEVNVEGTRNAIGFAQGLRSLRSFNHVSTAYVSGARAYPDRVAEEVEAELREYKNPYEESKHRAERIVAQSGLPHFVFRPSVIFGETYSGRGDGKTVYGVAQLFRLAKQLAERESNGNLNSDQPNGNGHGGPVFRVRARAEATLNIIPVDWVVDEMLRIRAGSAPAGNVFHITHPRPITIREMHDVIMPLCGIARCDIDPALETCDLGQAEKFLFRRLNAFRPYMMESDPVFDRSNVERVLGKSDPKAIDENLFHFALDTFFRIDRANGAAAKSPSIPVVAAATERKPVAGTKA